MEGQGIDVLLVHTQENIYYLSGFQSMGYYAYGCLVIPLEKEPYFGSAGCWRNSIGCAFHG